MKNSNEVAKEGDIGFKSRSVLWYLTFFGFAINYIVRINASITIVDMVDANYRNLNSSDDNSSYVSLERRFLDFLGVSGVGLNYFQCHFEFIHKVEYERDGFKWDEHTQSTVLGSFFWLHWATQLPGGILASKYGTKFIFGLANFVPSVMCLVIPLVCYLDYRWMIGLRFMQGVLTGLSWPGVLIG